MPPDPPRKVRLQRTVFPLPLRKNPLPAELKFRENPGFVNEILTCGDSNESC